MSGSNIVPYNPNDPTQQAFLATLQQGESGGYSNPYFIGYGGANLTGASTDAFGFPQWTGASVNGSETHAAGAYQFQPGTWDQIAAQYNLNFQNPADQNAAAWYLAQQNYNNSTGGSLYNDLNSGDYQQVATTLLPTWTSLNATNLASNFGSVANSSNNNINLADNPISEGYGSNGAIAEPASFWSDLLGTQGYAGQLETGQTPPEAQFYNPQGGLALSGGLLQDVNTWFANALGGVENWFVRGGLLIVGAAIIIVGLVYISGNGPTANDIKGFVRMGAE